MTVVPAADASNTPPTIGAAGLEYVKVKPAARVNTEVDAFNPVNAPFIVGTPLARYVEFAPIVTAPECVMRAPAFSVKLPFKIVAPEIVVMTALAKVAEPPIFMVKLDEKP